jgi:hypothetical protein
VVVSFRWNLELGIPDLLIYLVFGNFAEVLEKMMVVLPSFIIMAKTTPPGVEAIMISLTMTIINLNLTILR